MGQMHFSRKMGRRFLHALKRLGGAASSLQLADELDTLNVNCAASDARRVLEEFGVPGARKDAVTCRFSRETEDGTHVFVYRLRPDVRVLIARGLLEGRPVQPSLFAGRESHGAG